MQTSLLACLNISSIHSQIWKVIGPYSRTSSLLFSTVLQELQHFSPPDLTVLFRGSCHALGRVSMENATAATLLSKLTNQAIKPDVRRFTFKTPFLSVQLDNRTMELQGDTLHCSN